MQTISARQARERFSELLNAAARGETVAISRHGKEVARIVPPGRKQRRKPPSMEEFRATIALKGKPMSDEISAMRDEERS